MIPRISTPAEEGVFQAAKWLKIQALIDGDELAKLLEALPTMQIYPLSGAFSLDQLPMKREAFLAAYRFWIETLQRGAVPDGSLLRAAAWTCSPDSLWLQEIPVSRYLVKPCAPIVQVQAHEMGYSTVDEVFRPMVLSQESIFWGLQFSFPQVYQEPKTQELREVEESANAELFQTIRRWIREHTLATPMLVHGKRVNLPMRLGRACFSWINNHPQLQQRGLSVVNLC